MGLIFLKSTKSIPINLQQKQRQTAHYAAYAMTIMRQNRQVERKIALEQYSKANICEVFKSLLFL